MQVTGRGKEENVASELWQSSCKLWAAMHITRLPCRSLEEGRKRSSLRAVAEQLQLWAACTSQGCHCKGQGWCHLMG